MKDHFTVLLWPVLLLTLVYWMPDYAFGWFLPLCFALAGLSGFICFLESKNSSVLFFKMIFLFFGAGMLHYSLGTVGLMLSIAFIAVVSILVLAGQFVLDCLCKVDSRLNQQD